VEAWYKKARKFCPSKEQQFNRRLVGNEENVHTIPNSSRTMRNMTNELSDVQKKIISQRGNHG
jgi:hypothetical protein